MGYLFYMERDGWIPMGSSGEIAVPKSVRSRRALLKLAESFLGNRAGRIYYMTSWTQQMSELGPWNFCYYIKNHGELVAHHYEGECE